MKIYEIYDEENNISIGALIYYEKEHGFIIELREDLDEWTAPLLFAGQIRNRQYTVLSDASLMWVKDRVIPSGRQNINYILKNHKLKEYNEIDFLELAEGRCSQDSLYIRKLDGIPDYVRTRAEKNVVECFLTGNDEVLCFFADDVVKKVSLSTLGDFHGIDKVLKNRQLLDTLKIGIGGYSIIFIDQIEVSARILYEKGELIPVSLKDFVSFARKNLVDTSEACNILECSRQNLSYMVKVGDLRPVKENVKGNVYLKGAVVSNLW